MDINRSAACPLVGHLASPMSGTARVWYVPLERRRRRQDSEYAARRALFLQSYRFSADERPEEGEGLRVRLARRIRAAVARAGAGLARASRGWGWRPRAHPMLGCFRPGHHHQHKYYLHGYA